MTFLNKYIDHATFMEKKQEKKTGIRLDCYEEIRSLALRWKAALLLLCLSSKEKIEAANPRRRTASSSTSQDSSNWSGSNLFKLVQIGSKWIQLVLTCSNWIKPVENGSNWFVLQREDQGCQPSTTEGLQFNQPRFHKSVW